VTVPAKLEKSVSRVAFEIEERITAGLFVNVSGGGVTGRAQADVLFLVARRCRFLEDAPGFEEADGGCAAVEVPAEHVEHAGEERGAHGGGFVAERVG